MSGKVQVKPHHLFLTAGTLGALLFLVALLTCRISGGPF